MQSRRWDAYRCRVMPYERFHAWQACDELVLAVYRVTRSFPVNERYGLTAQSRRAAFSTAANIAEGSAKRGKPEFCRFLNISIGSLAEVAYAIRLARKLEYITDDQWRELDALRNRASRLTWKLYDSMRGER
jgi:four helix bundle protein